MKQLSFFYIFFLFVLLSLQTTYAQDRVHLKNNYTFKSDGKVIYKGKANESFRLREIEKKILKIELPDATIVEINPKNILEKRGYFTVMQDCYVFSEKKKSYKEWDVKNKKFIVDSLKAGMVVLHKENFIYSVSFSEFRVKTPKGIFGYVDANYLRPDLYYAVTLSNLEIYLYNIKDPVSEGLKALIEKKGANLANSFLIPPDTKFIVIDLVKPYVKLRTIDGREGWGFKENIKTDFELKSLTDRIPWLYNFLSNLCKWGAKGFWSGALVFLLYAVILFLYAFVPVALIAYPVIRIKWMPNFICKFLIWIIPLPFFLITGMSLLMYPPFRGDGWAVPLAILCVVWVVAVVFKTMSGFSGFITHERCPKCHCLEDNTVLDENSREYVETTTTTYGDGRKDEKKKNIVMVDIVKQCNQCGRIWRYSYRAV